MKPIVYTCPHCGDAYFLGINGVETGCDECEGIVRNPIDHTIVPMTDLVFVEEA